MIKSFLREICTNETDPLSALGLRKKPFSQADWALFWLLTTTIFTFFFMGSFTADFVWDDFLISENFVVKEGLSPLLFWTRGHEFTKAWPLFYSLAWGVFRVAGKTAALYHLINLLLHYSNGWLAYAIGKKLRFRFAWVAPLIIWFHPLNIEPVFGIIQISKVLAGSFVLLWIRSWGSAPGKKGHVVGILFLFASTFSAGFSYLLGILELARHNMFHSWKRALTLSVPCLLFSIYGIFLVSSGIGARATEASNVQRYLLSSPQQRRMADVPVRQIDKEQEYFQQMIPVADSSVRGALIYLFSFFKTLTPNIDLSPQKLWTSKLASIGITATFYIENFIYPINNHVFYPPPEPSSFDSLPMQVLGLSVFFAIALTIYFKNYFALGLLLTFLPISGLFYVPFMKFTLFADKYAYVPYLFAALLVTQRMEKNGRLLNAAIAVWLFFLICRTGSYVMEFAPLTGVPFGILQQY